MHSFRYTSHFFKIEYYEEDQPANLNSCFIFILGPGIGSFEGHPGLQG